MRDAAGRSGRLAPTHTRRGGPSERFPSTLEAVRSMLTQAFARGGRYAARSAPSDTTTTLITPWEPRRNEKPSA